MLKYLITIISVLVLSCNAAEARHYKHHKHHHVHHKHLHIAKVVVVQNCSIFIPCETTKVNRYEPTPTFTPTRASDSRTIVAHPAGCPSRAFCGCGAAVRVFGHAVRELWLAANWYKYPRTSPAPGMVAVRPHHTFVLEADLGNGMWEVYDANSGHGMTQIHARSIAGYTIVNPHG